MDIYQFSLDVFPTNANNFIHRKTVEVHNKTATQR